MIGGLVWIVRAGGLRPGVVGAGRLIASVGGGGLIACVGWVVGWLLLGGECRRSGQQWLVGGRSVHRGVGVGGAIGSCSFRRSSKPRSTSTNIGRRNTCVNKRNGWWRTT